MNGFFAGLDLGQSQDYTCLAVVERVDYPEVEEQYEETKNYVNLGPVKVKKWRLVKPQPPTLYHLRHLQRWIGVSYEDIIADVKSALATVDRCELAIDYGGPGRPVFDRFRSSGLKPIAIGIHGGVAVTRNDAGGFNVPKRDLAGAVAVCLQNRTLRVTPDIPEGRLLESELKAFKVKIDPRTAHDSYAAGREKDHDDMVLATAIALWSAMRTHRSFYVPVPAAWPH